ncbi:MAG: YgjV family protein [Ruminococcaceae bacterium]|nr:YgjV family protein [Oscillospiraceae bacterium]
MTLKEWIAQAFGIIGLVLVVLSFQCKKNKFFFLMQGLGSLAFGINFIMIQAFAGGFFSLVNFVRGVLFSKNGKKVWKLALVAALYTFCYIFSLFLLDGNWIEIVIATIPYAALVAMSVFMWFGNGKHIRYSQLFFMSPAWMIYDIFYFSLGAILCESFTIISTIVSFVRYGKDGFERSES